MKERIQNLRKRGIEAGCEIIGLKIQLSATYMREIIGNIWVCRCSQRCSSHISDEYVGLNPVERSGEESHGCEPSVCRGI